MDTQRVPMDHGVGSGASRSAQRSAHVKSASRALDIIEVLASERTGLAFTDIARLEQIPKSSLHALLAVLTERGFVEFDPQSRSYSLGIRTWEMGQAYLAHRDLVEKALPLMQQVVAAINETVQLAVLDGIENVYLAKVDCSHPVRLQSEVGRRLFAHATGLGKVLLAELPEDIARSRFSESTLAKLSAQTIQDPDRLFDALTYIRARGFAVDNQEYTAGLRCVAVPIVGAEGHAIAALSASIPITRAGPDEMTEALRHIASASIDISRRLGVSTPDQRLASLTQWRGDVMAQEPDGSDRRLVTGPTGIG